MVLNTKKFTAPFEEISQQELINKFLFVEQEDATAAGPVSARARQNCNRWQLTVVKNHHFCAQ